MHLVGYVIQSSKKVGHTSMTQSLSSETAPQVN